MLDFVHRAQHRHADMNAQRLTSKLEDALTQTRVPLICAYLYGSHARSQARSDSDVDVAVMLDSSVTQGLIGPLPQLRGELERALGCEVDLVDLRTAPPDLVHRILRDGHLVLDRAPNDRIAFEVQARNTYFDLLPYLREYRREQAT